MAGTSSGQPILLGSWAWPALGLTKLEAAGNARAGVGRLKGQSDWGAGGDSSSVPPGMGVSYICWWDIAVISHHSQLCHRHHHHHHHYHHRRCHHHHQHHYTRRCPGKALNLLSQDSIENAARFLGRTLQALEADSFHSQKCSNSLPVSEDRDTQPMIIRPGAAKQRLDEPPVAVPPPPAMLSPQQL